MVGQQGWRDGRRERIKDLLPGRKGATGATAKDNRSFAEAVLYRCRADLLRRDPPGVSEISASFTRGTRGGARAAHGKRFSSIWRWMPTMKRQDRLDDCPRPPARRRRERGDRQTECVGRPTGGPTTKIHPTGNALGNPTGFHLTSGQARDLQGADALLPGILDNIQSLLADPSDDARERVLDLLKRAEVEGVIPPRSNRTDQRDHDEDKHAWRHLIRNRFAKLKLRDRLAPGSV